MNDHAPATSQNQNTRNGNQSNAGIHTHNMDIRNLSNSNRTRQNLNMVIDQQRYAQFTGEQWRGEHTRSFNGWERIRVLSGWVQNGDGTQQPQRAVQAAQQPQRAVQAAQQPQRPVQAAQQPAQAAQQPQRPLDPLQYLCTDDFSPIQRHIVQCRINKIPYSKITFDGASLYKRQISKCLQRSALGLRWDLSSSKGNNPYLCKSDVDLLIEECKEAFYQGAPMDSYELIDRAFEIRQDRIANGCQFLALTDSRELAETLLQKESNPPSRPWIHLLLARTHMQLRDRRQIKLQRLTGCSRDIFVSYFSLYGPIFNSTSPFLIFGADETMLETLLGTKVAVPEGTQEAIAAEVEGFPHISVMCCHSIFGEVMPPFMILPTIGTLPEELKPFASSGQIDIACAPSGYMNKDAFLLWTITFINRLYAYRLKLHREIGNQRALLILDGHSSRACPLALFLLDRANVDMIVEPSNTNHVIQMFDVGLARPFKTNFRTIFHRLEKKDITEYRTIIARLRSHAAQAILSAWASASGIANKLSAAKATGMYPYDPDSVLSSRFIIHTTPEMRRRQEERDRRRQAGIDINGKMITQAAVIEEIKIKVARQIRYSHLCTIPPPFARYSELVRYYTERSNNGTQLLTKPPPIVMEGCIPERGGGNSLNFSYMRKHREYTDSSLYTQKQGNRFGEK